MARKKQPDINIIDPGDPKPLYIARAKVEKIFIGLRPRTLANMASEGRGPPFFKNRGICWYKISDLEEWIVRFPVKTFNPEHD